LLLSNVPLFRLAVPVRVALGATLTATLMISVGAALLSVQAAVRHQSPAVPERGSIDLQGLRPTLVFNSPRAAIAEAPTVATLGVDGPAGRFHVPYIQTTADLPVSLAQNGPADRTIVDVVLDAGTPGERVVRLTHAPWRTVFHDLAFGEHTLAARMYVPEEGVPAEVALQAPPVAEARLERVARGDVVAALGDSTTEGLGEGPWPPGREQALGFFPNWLAAQRSLQASPDWITTDGRNFPQVGLTMHPASRPSFTVELARLLAARRGHPVLVLNYGWSGTTSDGFMRISTSSYFSQQVATTSPNTWLINLGVNDPLLNRSPAEYGDRMQGLVSNLEKLYGAAPADIHVACPIYATQPARNQAEARYLPVVDHLRAVNHLGAAPNFFAFFRAHPETVADAVHPNFAGYTATAELWDAALAGQGPGCQG
jgi:lysophospholipase L1-like esterase